MELVKWKVSFILALTLLLSFPIASATCLSPQQILLISDMADAVNLSTNDLVDLFESNCNKTDSYIEEQSLIIADLYNWKSEFQSDVGDMVQAVNESNFKQNNATKYYLITWTKNETDFLKVWIDSRLEDQIEISRALQSVADVVNASLTIDRISEVVDSRTEVYVDKMDDRLTDMRDELSTYTTQDDLDKLYLNMTGYVNTQIYQQNKQQPQPIGIEVYLIAIVVLVIVGYVWYNNRKSNKIKEIAKLSAPKIYRPRQLTKNESDYISQQEDYLKEKEEMENKWINKEGNLLKDELKEKKKTEDKKDKPPEKEDNLELE